MPLSPGTRFGHYEIAALIGAGGMGEVYRALDTNLRRDVAIKILPEHFASDADRLARFRREAEMLATLNHQNIAHVYGLERSGALTGLVMELVDGPTLAERIAQGPLAFAEALPVALQIADALEAAHERAIVHRDLKPANIKLRADGTVKVLDFGIAKALQPTFTASGPETLVANTPSLTQMGMILGTAAYMSPEQARGKTVGKRTDVWAFGCVVYEMLAGRPAFEGEDATIIIGRVLEREIDMSALPNDVPPSVRQTLKACLQKDVKKRVRDIGDVKLALDGAFETAVESAPARSSGRHLASLAAAFIAAIAALPLAAWWLWPAPELRAVTRFSVPIAVAERFVSISRDGARVAYRAGADRSIHIRELDEFDARRITGTAGAAIDMPPCFSPDGTWIAFFTGGQQLKKLSLSGGGAVAVAQGFGTANVCSWGEDGYLYFTTNSGVMRARDAGGAAEVVAPLNAERNEVSFQSPQLLPGGERLLYSVYGSENSGTARIDVLDLATRERKTVLDGVGVATYVPARRAASRGYLVYGSGGALFAAPFDPVRGQAGAALPVASEVIGLGAFSSGAVSESGTLAYLSDPRTDIVEAGATLIAVDRTGEERIVSARPQIYGELSISPDGTRAFLSRQDAQTSSIIDLLMYEFDGDRMSRLPLDGANFAAVWTADSRRLVYMHTRTFAARPTISEVRSVPADQSGPPTSITGPTDWMRGIPVPTSLSADGRTLLVTNDSLVAGDVLGFELGGGLDPKTISAPRDFLVTNFRERHAAFSPDGNAVAYTSDQSGADEIYVAPYPGPGGRLSVSQGGGAFPRWSGRELFYVSGGNLMSVDVETAPLLRASTPRVLFAIPPLADYGGSPYDVSPDGTRFLMLKAGTGSQPVELRVVVNWLDELERAERAAQQ
jgi:serine/threonine-protein kinase